MASSCKCTCFFWHSASEQQQADKPVNMLIQTSKRDSQVNYVTVVCVLSGHIRRPAATPGFVARCHHSKSWGTYLEGEKLLEWHNRGTILRSQTFFNHLVPTYLETNLSLLIMGMTILAATGSSSLTTRLQDFSPPLQ